MVEFGSLSVLSTSPVVQDFEPSTVGFVLVCPSHLSNEENPGWLGCIGDYTTQLYRDSNKQL